MACGNKSLPNDDELAIEAVRIGVAAYRSGGHKSLKALALLAIHIRGISARRIRGLFFREHGRDTVAPGERAAIRFGVARALRAHADQLERKAGELRDLANEIDREELAWGAHSPSAAAPRLAA